MVFLRRNPSGGSEHDPFPGYRPDDLFEWKIGSPRLKALPLPGSEGTRWPKGLTGIVSGLAFDGTQLAYETSVYTAKRNGSVVTLWRQRLGHNLEPIAQTTSGGASVCAPRFLSPVFSGGWLYYYFHACGSTGIVHDRWIRYWLTGRRVQRAIHMFILRADEQIFSVVPVANGVIWDDGEVHELQNIAWSSTSQTRPKGFPPSP